MEFLKNPLDRGGGEQVPAWRAELLEHRRPRYDRNIAQTRFAHHFILMSLIANLAAPVVVQTPWPKNEPPKVKPT